MNQTDELMADDELTELRSKNVGYSTTGNVWEIMIAF
jgi:hypothetical protein